MTTMTDVHTLSGAYALDALGADEAAEFRRHLSGCSSCCDEVRELRDAAARMGAVETIEPPAELRARVLAAADRTPQFPPVVVPLQQRRREAPSRGRRWDKLALAAAGVFLVGGAAVGIGQVLENRGGPSLTAAEEVFGAEDARTADVATLNGGTLVVGVSSSRHQVAIDTSDLPARSGGRVYQLWQLRGERAESVEVIEEPGEEAVTALVEDSTVLALTIEPPGGSTEPTKDPIVKVDPREV